MTIQKNKFLVISGPNLNLLGHRETSIYQQGCLQDVHAELIAAATALNVVVECYQYNHEGDLIDHLQAAAEQYAGVIINAGALAHYSYALRSAIGSMFLPCVEVFISNVHAREDCHHNSVIAPVCLGVIGGFGKQSYMLGLQALVHLCKQ